MKNMENSKDPSSPSPRNNAVFSPINVSVSPASKIGQRGQLTGLPRTFRDSVADLYNLVQRWNKEHTEGCLILTKISDVKKTEFSEEKKEFNHASLQPLCNLLEKCCDIMGDIVDDMERISKEMTAAEKLARFQNHDLNNPLFLTWPISQFVNMTHYVASAYSSEVQVKKLVLRKVALTKNETNLTFFVASWIHQPSLPAEIVNMKIEAALLETGLR